jgi:hypothetical protein
MQDLWTPPPIHPLAHRGFAQPPWKAAPRLSTAAWKTRRRVSHSGRIPDDDDGQYQRIPGLESLRSSFWQPARISGIAPARFSGTGSKEFVVPRGDTVIEAEDQVVFVGPTLAVKNARDLFLVRA